MKPGRYAAVDGQAHLTIYVEELGVSIVSRGDGCFHLSAGGYGEPVLLTLDEPDGFSELPLVAAIGELEGVAYEFAKVLTARANT